MFPRHVEPLLTETLADTPVVLLNGARQTGKSTLAKAIAARDGRRYLTLDDRVVLAAARADPAGFIAGLTGPVVMDEIQRVPDLFLDIKAAVDRERTPGRFLLTGSANVLLLPTLADSLAGRMTTLHLWPLSGAERAGDPSFNRADALCDGDLEGVTATPCERETLIHHMLQGGYPEAVARKAWHRRAGWFESYVETLLQRDVRDLARLEQHFELPNLLQLLATRSATLLNFAELSRASGLSQTSLKRYFALLETLFLVTRVPAWARNPSKRLVRSPKLIVPDSGLLAWLAGHSPDKLTAQAGLPGSLVESFVAGELLKHLAHSRRGLSLWHYRTHGEVEVDFVLEDRQGAITGIEVKAGASVDASSFKGLRHLLETEGSRMRRGILFYGGSERVAFSEQLVAMPLSWWWAPGTATPAGPQAPFSP